MAPVDEDIFIILQEIKALNLNLKCEQEQAVVELERGKDVLAVLPTGFGKSRIFKAFQRLKDKQTNGKATILVIAPLASIVKDQLNELRAEGYLSADLSTLSRGDLQTCNFEIIFSSAEVTMRPDFREELKDCTSELHKRLCCIVIDESHTVETWTGKRKTKQKGKINKIYDQQPFRSAYGRLSTLRSLCNEGVPVLALTGTADSETQRTICRELVMCDPAKIFLSPNRQNIRISVKKSTKAEMHMQLDWLVDAVKELGTNVPKTIIFCNTLREIAVVVNHLVLKLGKFAYHPHSSNKREDMLIGIFHSVSWPEQKENILQSLSKNGLKRVIVASTALSMGVNFPDIRYIINWGPARTLLDHHQEAGRAGRDGNQSHVIVVYYGQQLSHCEDDVKYFVKSDSCYRVACYKPFDETIKPLYPGHRCCSICARTCNCDSPNCRIMLPFEQHSLSQATQSEAYITTRSVSDEDKKDIKKAFVEVSESIPVACGVFGPSTSHGFSGELIESILENCHRIFTLDDVNNYLPVFSTKHALKILEIMDEVFGDIPSLQSLQVLIRKEHTVVDSFEEFINTEYDLTESDISDLDLLEYDEMF